MARYFFDAMSDDLVITDFHGREICEKQEVRPAIIEAVREIKAFVGTQHESAAWNLTIRIGESTGIAVMRFDEVDALNTVESPEVLARVA